MAAKVRNAVVPVVNGLVLDESDGKLYRIVLAGGGALDVLLCNVHGSRLEITRMTVVEFQARADPGYQGEGRLVAVEQDPFSRFNQPGSATSGSREKSAENWRRIEWLHRSPAEFIKTLRGGANRTRILAEHAKEHDVTLQLMRRLHRLYLQRGMNKSAMASTYWRSGRMEQPARADKPGENATQIKRRGYKRRPGRKPSGEGEYALPSERLEHLLEQHTDIYLTSRRGPWRIEVSDERIEEIRSAVADKGFPAKSGSRAKLKYRQIEPHKRRWPRPSRGRDGKRARLTMQNVVDHLNYVCRCTRQVRDIGGQVIELDLAPIDQVTVRQFQHYYLTRVPIAVRKRRAMGDRQYALTGRPKHGHALQHCPGPGAQYMIDATVADVYLISAFDRTLVVGRPTVYLAMDVWSRMIVGVHVTLEPPSFEGVALVLENIVTPKDEFCARYGLRIGPDFWPCRYLPSIGFQTDHGSDYLKAQAWKTATQDLHVSISNVRVLDPLMRGLIERRFGIIPAQFQRASFGVVERDVTTRGAPRYAWDATDTLTEFTRKLLRAILINMRMPIGHEGAQPEMVFQGIADTPFNRWSYGMDNFTGSLRKHSIDEVRMATWPHSTAVPTDRGLLWNGAYYTSDRIEDTLIHCWGKDADKEVPIQYNPDDMSQILLEGKNHPEYGVLAGTNRQSPGSCSLLQWNIYRKRDRANARKEKDAMQPARVMQLINDAQESCNSKKEQSKALGQSEMKHPATGGMRDAREREKEVAKKVARTGSAPNAASSADRLSQDSERDTDTEESDIAGRLKRATLSLLET